MEVYNMTFIIAFPVKVNNKQFTHVHLILHLTCEIMEIEWKFRKYKEQNMYVSQNVSYPFFYLATMTLKWRN